MQLLSLPSKGDPAWTPTDWNAPRKVSWNGPNDGGAGPTAAQWPKMRDVDDQTDQGSATPGTSFGNDHPRDADMRHNMGAVYST